ncbi:MAG: hypothetical protein LCH84_01935 [Gemmatimonadetes bacterium]|nr:hypothetical protein [Gemmatimonadota bacterium]
MPHSRWASQMVRSAVALGAATMMSAGCTGADRSSPTEAERSALAQIGTDAVWVLDQVEQQRGAPIVTVDLPCTAGRVRHLVHDTIALRADGSARRNIMLRREMADTLLEESGSTSTGAWRASGTTVSLSLRVANGREIPRYDVQLEADGSLSMRSGLGGSCAGAANTGRAATFVYRRAR